MKQEPTTAVRKLLLVGAVTLFASASIHAEEPQLKAAKLADTPNVHQFEKVLLCGQPSREALREAKQRGVQAVLNLRQADETDWNEESVVQELGMEYHHLPFQSPASLTDEIFDKSRKVLRRAKEKPVLLHCGSANRVGAIWLVHRVLDDGLSTEQAAVEAREVGLRTEAYRRKALDYIQRQRDQQN